MLTFLFIINLTHDCSEYQQWHVSGDDGIWQSKMIDGSSQQGTKR